MKTKNLLLTLKNIKDNKLSVWGITVNYDGRKGFDINKMHNDLATLALENAFDSIDDYEDLTRKLRESIEVREINIDPNLNAIDKQLEMLSYETKEINKYDEAISAGFVTVVNIHENLRDILINIRDSTFTTSEAFVNYKISFDWTK